MQVRFNPPSARAPSAKPVPRLVVAKAPAMPPWGAPSATSDAGRMVIFVTSENYSKGAFEGIVLRAPSDSSASEANRVGTFLRSCLSENFEDFIGTISLEND